MTAPVARALHGSRLAPAIKPGLQAIPNDQRHHIEPSLRSGFADSLDLDDATRAMHPNDARWDYLLGHTSSEHVVAVEAHSAQTSQVSLVIEKRAASRRHLKDHLADGHHVAAWYWVASGRVDFVPHEKAMNRLSENGIEFVGRQLSAKHLAAQAGRSDRRPPRPNKRR